ncbi:hypothetical protein FOMA001_g17996 [Fusarium oxysporum f. sp. matthiolae]|nr:hypothetical protein FOMA001_g17996 [Fusarium oxysporum f. sp. matthiolae]
MWAVFEEVLDDAYVATVRDCYPGTAELFEIARKEVHVTTTKPFQGLMEPDAWERYKSRSRSSSASSSDTSTDKDNDSSSSSRSDSPSVSSSNSTEGRPPYRMTIRQEEAWKAFDNGITQVVTGADREGRFSHEWLKRSCLDTVVQFFDHLFKSGNHYKNIVISALAVIGLEEGGGWMPVVNYTPIYSAVIKGARYLVLHQSMIERRGQMAQLGQYMSAREAEEQAEGLFRIVSRKVRRFMTRIVDGEGADPTPMNWIMNTKTYGMQVRYTTPGSETIDWRGDQIIHGRVKIRMGEISDMLHGLVGEARQTLLQLTSGRVGNNVDDGQAEEGEEDEDKSSGDDDTQWPPKPSGLPVIPWSKIEDRHGESTLDHSFLCDEENQGWVKKGNGWVQDQINASTARTKTWLA